MTVLDQQTKEARARVSLVDCQGEEESFSEAIRSGLRQSRKEIPCRFLYDERGSALFDRICALPEYYVTRTETKILRTRARDMAKAIGADACLIELGSGSSVKTRILLDALERPRMYVPIDVSREHLYGAAKSIAGDYPKLRVVAVCGDYSDDLDLPRTDARKAAFFPGSTIGNLERGDALGLLRGWADKLGAGGIMILGADLQKDPAIIEAAYNDSEGVTEAFIRNVLKRINRELDGDFDLQRFSYDARYVGERGRVEMHLRSECDQTVTVAGERFAFKSGERVHIENSHKYTVEDLSALGRLAGFTPVRVFTDPDRLFSVHVWKVA